MKQSIIQAKKLVRSSILKTNIKPLKKWTPYIIKGGKIIQFYVKGAYNLDTQKISTEATENSAMTAQNLCRMVEYIIVKKTFVFTARYGTCEEYKKKTNVQNKMRFNKCNAYTAKVTLMYKGGESYISAARSAAKSNENREGQEKKRLIKVPQCGGERKPGKNRTE